MRKTKLLSFLMALCLMLGMAVVPAQNVRASEANENILEARNGVLQVAAAVVVDGEEMVYTHVGTGFLIGNEDGAQTVITNYHVAHSLTEEIARANFQIPAESSVEIRLSVVVRRDVRINASTVNESAQADFSILRLEQPIYDRAPLKLTDSDYVTPTQAVYALGFPGIVQDIQNDGVYTSDDVTVTSGIVSKTSDVVLADSPIECITHSAQVTYGNSGGPLVDQNGYVIGINTIMSNEDGNHDYFFSTKINEVRQVLDALGIEYIFVDPDITPDPTAEPTTEAPATEPETETPPAETTPVETGSFLEETEPATESPRQPEQDEAEEQEDTGLGTTQIILIAAAAVAVIVVIVVIIAVTSSSKKKKAKAAQAQRQKAGMQQPNGVPPVQGGWNPNPQPIPPQPPINRAPVPPRPNNDGSTETSVLNSGAGETTLLSGGASLPAAYLIRVKNSERVAINKQVFRVGKERRRVDYCIADNTNVSRVHADILYKENAFYLVDDNTTNGTTINGISLVGGREYILKNGDVIKMADEEFRFQM